MVAGDDDKTKLIVRRKAANEEHGHIAAWKIAYADFVTAMMAFFLLLWLLNASMTVDLVSLGNSFTEDPDADLEEVMSPGGSTSSGGIAIDQTEGAAINQNVVDKILIEQLETKKVSIEISPDKAGITKEQFQDQASIRESSEDFILRDVENRLRKALNQLYSENPDQTVETQIYVDEEGLNIEFVSEGDKRTFRWRSAEITRPLHSTLFFISRYLASLDRPIFITGHAAEEGDSVFNWRISVERADRVRQVMARMGVTNKRLFGIGGKGATQLLNKEDPKDFANIRIQVTLLSRKDQLLVHENIRNSNPNSIIFR